ncbi:hypothetical protein IX51_04975 [uncultured archaeon]|nr:hypothetical protein IX51_04975 [uncultured archaeon]HKJ97200.1 hypothetical protein [Thermoplasmataceae archaeon]
MDDHDPLRARISNARRYSELLGLRDSVWNLSGKIDFSSYVDLRKRVDDRIRDFETPECEDIEIRILFPDRDPSLLDLRECRIAMGKNASLPKYIFSKYDNAEDIEIRPLGISMEGENSNSTAFDPQKAGDSNAHFNPKLGILQNRIEKVIKLANYMNETYSTVIPKISSDLNDIVSKLEELYKRVSNNEYELRDGGI